MYKIVQKTKYITTASVVAVVACFAVWGFVWNDQVQRGVTSQYGFELGIDFTGGSAIELQFPTPEARPNVDIVRDRLASAGVQASLVQTVGDTGVSIKAQYLDTTGRDTVLQQFVQEGATENSYTNIGPTLGNELKRKAFIALGLVMLGIIAYITYAFRLINKGPVPSWVFGLGAIVALLHDVIIVLGIYVVLGAVWKVQIDTLFVTALLTVLGFSVHDTIVVYDRIREGLKQQKRYTFAEIVNRSINSTLARSLNTSITTLFVLTALYFFGGASIQYFVLALIIGIIVGTYSSIFVASPVLIIADYLLNRRKTHQQ